MVPLGSYLSKLLDFFCNDTKYVQFLDQCWRQQITWQITQLIWSSAGRLRFVNLENREEIPNVITKGSVDLFPISITSVNYCIVSGMTQNTLSYFINAGINKKHEKDWADTVSRRTSQLCHGCSVIIAHHQTTLQSF